MDKFVPRQVFPHYGAIPRSYFLGHHRAGLSKMKNMLSSIDYVVECRDYRAPVTSINPMFEEALGQKRRIVIYTKRDLGNIPQSPAQRLVSYTECWHDISNNALTRWILDRKEGPKLRPQECCFLHQLPLPRGLHSNHQTPPRRCRGSRQACRVSGYGSWNAQRG